MEYTPVSKRTGVDTSPFTYIPVDERTPKEKEVATKKTGVPFVSKVLNKIDSLTARPEEGSAKEKTTLGQLPAAIAENLPFGIGGIVRTTRDEPEVVADVGLKDVGKGIVETFKDYVIKYPAMVVSNLAMKPVKFNIPGIGEITNRQFQAAERIKNGENQAEVLLSEGSGAIFDTLFLVGMAQKVFGARPTTVAKATQPKEGTITVKNQPKSFRLYQEPTATQPISPEFMQRMANEQGITIKNYNPKLPTYFRITGKAGGKVVGEVVQIKPSYFETFISKLKGDINKVPTEQVIPVASKETTMKALETTPAEPQTPVVQTTPPAVPPVKPTIIPPSVVPPAVPKMEVKPATLPQAPAKPIEYTPVEKREVIAPFPEMKEPKPAPEIEEVEVPAEVQAKADEEWAEKYAEGEAKRFDEVQKLQEELKTANKARRDILETNINLINAESAKIEKEFLSKWTEIAKLRKDVLSGKAFEKPAVPTTKSEIKEYNKLKEKITTTYLKGIIEDLKNDRHASAIIQGYGATFQDEFKQFRNAMIDVLEENGQHNLAEQVRSDTGMLTKTGTRKPAVPKPSKEVKDTRIDLDKVFPPKPKEKLKAVPKTERVHEPIREVKIGDRAIKISVPTSKTAYDKYRIIKGTYKGKPYTTDAYILELSDLPELQKTEKEPPTEDAIQQVVFDRTEKNKYELTKPIGYADKFGYANKRIDDLQDPVLVFKAGNEYIKIDKKYYNYFAKKFKNMRLMAGSPTDPVRVYDGNDFKAVVMPIAPGKVDIYSFETGKKITEKFTEHQKNVLKKAKEFDRKQQGVSVKDVTPKGYGPSSGVEADIGTFADGTPIKVGHLDKVQPIEMPELVELAKEIMGVPKIRRAMGNKLGLFRPRGKGEIELRADIFKDPAQAAKTLAHEIGHLVDYLPDRMMKRGNLLGHLLTLSNFRKNVFEDIIAKNSDLRKELIDVSNYWRPSFDPKANDSYSIYRKSAKELYADAISMLLNSPGLLEEKAPIFYKTFFEQLDNKPSVRDAYFDLQARLNGDRQIIINARREGVRGMFKEGDFKAWELQKAREAEKTARNKDFLFRFKFELVDRNQALIDRVNQAQKSGKIIPDDENPLYYLEERNYVGGKQKSLLERYFSPVYKNLKEADITWTDFGEIMFYRRIVSGDRSEQANPRGITPDAAKELLQDIESNLTEQQLKVVAEQINKFKDGVRKINEEAYEEGMYSPELYQKMQENPDYATFRVLDHLEENVTSKIYKSIGTLKDIQNPADATIMKTLATLRAVEHQKTKRAVVDFLQKNYSQDIKEAQTRWAGKRREFIESKKEREELVVLYSKVNKGKTEGYYVDPYIKASLDNESVGSNNLLIGSLKMLNSGLFRPLYIGFNPGFQAFNLMRDFQRFWKNVPGMTLLGAMKKYAQALPAAKARAFGTGSKEAMETIMDMEEKQILSVTYNDLVFGENVEDIQLNTILHKSGIDSFAVPKKTPMLMKPILATLDFVKKLGDLIETLPKVAGYYEFTGNRSKPISKEDASFIRKNVGSPDFLAGGHLKPATNEVFLFSNAITQGLRADYNVATNPRTRSGYWWKTAKMNFVPKLLMYLAVLGVFGETVRKIMEGATEYDKTNYTIVPLGFDENGKSIYIRIPQDETGRLLSGLTWKILTAANNQQSLPKDIIDTISFTGGQIPSLNPAIQDISAITQFMAGQNPYDFFRNREVLSDDVYKAGGSAAFKQFAGWLFNQNGGGIFYRFYSEPSVPTPKSKQEQIFNLPVLGNIAGRFVRITDYGVKEKITEVKQEATTEDARRRLSEKELVNSYLEKYQKAEGTGSELMSQMLKEAFPNGIKSKDDVDKKDRLIQRFNSSLKKGYADSNVRAVMDAVSNNEKKAIIGYLKDTLSAEEYADFKSEALKAKATTAEVFYETERQK